MQPIPEIFAFRPHYPVALIASIFVSIAAHLDLQSFRIPNWLTGMMLVCGLLLHGLMPQFLGIYLSMCGLMVGLLCFWPFYVIGGIGAGDIKLMAALGAWLGPQGIVQVYIVTSVFIGLASVLKILTTQDDSKISGKLKRLFPGAASGDLAETAKKSPQRLIPVGFLIAVALWLLILWKLVYEELALPV